MPVTVWADVSSTKENVVDNDNTNNGKIKHGSTVYPNGPYYYLLSRSPHWLPWVSAQCAENKREDGGKETRQQWLTFVVLVGQAMWEGHITMLPLNASTKQ